MTDNERAILAINAAAQARGLSYGQLVSRSTAAELEEVVFRFRLTEKKKKKH